MNGTKLREARKAAGLTQEALADMAGVSQPTISQLESGDACNPTLGILERVAAALGCPVRDLFFEPSARS